MLISNKKKFIFIAFWKTGTTSIENALTKYSSNNYTRWLRLKYKFIYHSRGAAFKHMPAYRCIRLVGDSTWNEYFTFAFVRNPWDRAASAYIRHFHKSEEDPKNGFDAWIKAGARPWISKRQLSQFLTDDNGQIVVDFVGRFERLEQDFNHICDILSINTNLPHRNKSPISRAYQELYTEENKEIVANWAKQDIELFGYKF
jgi:hypothetical protein